MTSQTLHIALSAKYVEKQLKHYRLTTETMLECTIELFNFESSVCFCSIAAENDSTSRANGRVILLALENTMVFYSVVAAVAIST